MSVVKCNRSLTLEEWIFVGEYLAHGNATKAVIAAGYVGDYAGDHGYRWLKKPWIEEEIRKANEVMRGRTELSAEMVAKDITDVLRADPRDLIQYITGSCRHCHGVNHDYQRTEGELRRDRRAWLIEHPEDDPEGFPLQGGAGYNAYRDPHPDCPECFGRGTQHPRLVDTRTLSPEAASLFEGIEQTRHGIKIKLRSKDAARDAAARYLGLNKETVNLTVTKKLEDYSDAELIQLMQSKGEG